MRNSTRFIPGEEIGAVAQWRFGDVDSASILMREQSDQSEDAAKAEITRQQGYAEGFVQGRAQAMLETQRQINEFTSNQGKEAARQFAALLESARTQLDTAEQMAAQGVLELACELARQVLRHEISGNPNVLLPVIREALGMLFADSRSVQVKLNPMDLDVLQDIVREEFPNVPLALSADPSITRGGCVIEAGGTVVDGRLEKRWARAISQLGQNMTWEAPSDDQ
jgi:flagellar assembly protein FliH